MKEINQVKAVKKCFFLKIFIHVSIHVFPDVSGDGFIDNNNSDVD